MSEYRRYRVAGGTYFFTVVTHERRPFLTTDLARETLREAIEKIQRDRPFTITAIVLLPDHLHAIWELPLGDTDYSTRWRRIKEEFTKNFLARGGMETYRSPSRKKRSERGVWQRRFWEHTIDSDDDFDNHFDYIHYNPKKHGLVASPVDWPYSSIHRWIEAGVYEKEWGRGEIKFDDLDQTAME